jgi:AcrR family transcriptional regulator
LAKEFGKDEKEMIRTALIEAGRELFSRYGLKRTGIGELTKAAGIAQGSFYIFFGSKEELYFEILEDEEKKIAGILEDMLDSAEITKSGFKIFMKKYFEIVHTNPFLENLIQKSEYERLMRKLPEEKRRKHLQGESELIDGAIKRLREQERIKNVDPEVLAGLYHALFLLRLHVKDIGEEVFPKVMDLITELMAEGLIIKDQ